MSNRCSLFGFFGWFIQGVLFFTSGSPLLWKWWHEKPRRAFITLVLDSSKQVGGNIGAHFINLALSALFSKNIKPVDSCGDEECLWYFLNFAIDVLLGVPVNYVILMSLKKLADKRRWKLIQGFGNYKEESAGGESNVLEGGHAHLKNVSFKRFGAQLFAWLMIVCTGKILLCIIILSNASALLQMSASLLASVRCHNASSMVELLVVMLVIPTVLNAVQFWLTDSFIKFYSVKSDSSGSLPKGGITNKNVKTEAIESNLLDDEHQPSSPKHERSPLIRSPSRVES